jgi:CheY-like chemotaxis protein
MATQSHPLQVMVVDDSDDFREAICALLVLEGYCPISCRNGETAWTQLCAGARPAALVVDLALPKMSGREFLRLLRSTTWGIPIPVLFLSGWHQLETFASETEHVLRKGTEPISIMRTIDRLTVRCASSGRRARRRPRGEKSISSS